MEQKNADVLPSGTAIDALIKRTEQGESSALLALYDATNRLVFGLITRILGDRASAEEALLDVYTEVWKQPADRDPRTSPTEWLLSLARDRAVARLYGQKREKTRRYSAGGADPGTTVAPEQQQRARAALEAIAPAHRELLGWAYYGGLSCGEMAAEIGRPIGAVRTHLRLGLGKFSETYFASGEETKSGADTGGNSAARKGD